MIGRPIDRFVDWLNDRAAGLSRDTSGTASAASPTWPIALARILLGVLWLGSLRWKLPPDFESDGETSLRQWLELEVEHAAFGVYGDIIDSVVLPNFTLFAWLVFLAELVVGLALLLGIATRPAALLGLLMSLNLLVGLLDVPGEWPWAYVLMAMWHGTILVSNADGLWSARALLPGGNRPLAQSSTS
ncbi:MAG: DoxX family membrane protein [Actinomycetota bacterium]